MLRKLVLERFKSFEHAEMTFGPLTVVVGPNASGKSNLRDALRFLHGVSRGYALAEILGEKWGEGGVLQWRGIRGGLREASFNNASSLALEIEYDTLGPSRALKSTYRIEVGVGTISSGPQVVRESLKVRGRFVFNTENIPHPSATHLRVRIDRQRLPITGLTRARPVLAQLAEYPGVGRLAREKARAALNAFSSMRFLDLSPDAMRLPSIPGQVVLGDRGENLSSVIQAICTNPAHKRGMLQWVRELTPMDVVDFTFPTDQTGRVLVTLVEQGGRAVSAYSASDGTLRFLAMVAALLGPESAQFYFFEELENGLHPTRLALLLQLIEQQTAGGDVQVVATTHSAQLLGLLGPEARSHAVESYRLEDTESTSLARLMDLPDAERIISEQGLARLHASGWIEDAVEFSAPEAA